MFHVVLNRERARIGEDEKETGVYKITIEYLDQGVLLGTFRERTRPKRQQEP